MKGKWPLKTITKEKWWEIMREIMDDNIPPERQKEIDELADKVEKEIDEIKTLENRGLLGVS